MYTYAPICLAVMLGMAGCATGFRAGAPKGQIDVIAHRGASAYAPENTLAAFEKSVEQEADWFELDCTLSRDGEVVVLHDKDLERTTNGAGNVMKTDWSVLKTLDAGSWYGPEFAGEKLPTLGDALDLAHDRIGVYIEIKNSADDGPLIGWMLKDLGAHDTLDSATRAAWMERVEASGSANLELTRKTIAAIRERKMKRQVVIQSFSPVVCFVALSEAPELRTEYLGGYDKDKPEGWENFLALGNFMEAHGFNVSHGSANEARLAAFQNAGKTVAVWTVDNPDDMKRYAAMGVNAIITNKPDLCRKVLQEMGKR
jgi:glycerophosphoryl diester phosphodiesterase